MTRDESLQHLNNLTKSLDDPEVMARWDKIIDEYEKTQKNREKS